MLGLRKVLVGVDGVPSEKRSTELVLPPPTREAVNLALRLAESSGVELTFLHVTPALPDEYAATTQAAARSLLDSLVEEAAQRNVHAAAHVAAGNVWVEVVRDVLRNGQQMVIVGSRQQSPARRLLLGSTGMKLLRNCPCPVWIVRRDRIPVESTVLVADDLTPVGERCLDLGVAAARLLDARLLVVHAVEFPLEGPLRHMGTPDDQVAAYRESILRKAEQAVQEHLSVTDHRTISQGSRTEVIAGRPDLVIEDAIAEHAAELLVMGTIARGGIPGLLIGNTAERLLPVVTCSLLAVKPDNIVCPIRPD
ncbi:MAG: universal stress protein [Planctomycetaceae bacterium]